MFSQQVRYLHIGTLIYTFLQLSEERQIVNNIHISHFKSIVACLGYRRFENYTDKKYYSEFLYACMMSNFHSVNFLTDYIHVYLAYIMMIYYDESSA